MTFNSFFETLSHRSGPAYGAGPAGFKRLMKRLGNPQANCKILHVAGTNGKGSVCYLCASVLQAAGYQTGLFISPHLQTLTERIQINGKKIPQTAFVRLAERVLAAEAEKLNFFEILTAVAFLHFAEKKVDYAVLETGLGGRKDPTNVCKPVASIITAIGLDHCAILGNTLVQIAREKAGIIKRKVPVFCGSLPAKAFSVVKQTADELQAPLTTIKTGNPFRLRQLNWQQNQTVLQNGTQNWILSVLGEKQVQNACLVYRVCRYLNITPRFIKQGFACVEIPGRFEIIRHKHKIIILDGAHNLQAMENLIAFLQKSPWAGKYAMLCGFMQDKDYPTMLKKIIPHVKKLYLTAVPHPRCVPAAVLKKSLASTTPTQAYVRAQQALEAALKEQAVVVISGSFYVVGNLRKYLLQRKYYARAARKD